MLTPSLDTVRLFIHILAAAVWVGGQIVLIGVVPPLRRIGPEASKAAANGFAKVAWPAFGLAFVTGIWNMLAIPTSASNAYNATLGIKVLLVVVAGASAAAHAQTSNRSVLATTGAVGGIASLTAFFLGVLLVTGT